MSEYDAIETIRTQGVSIVDAHVHTINRADFCYPWLGRAPAELSNGASADAYTEEAYGLGIVAAVHVEAGVAQEQRRLETESACRLLRPFASVVAGVDPCLCDRNADLSGSGLDRVAAVRVALHDKPLGTPPPRGIIDAIRDLSGRGLAIELSIRDDQIDVTKELVTEYQTTTFIIDHCGGASKGGNLFAWSEAIDDLAKIQNVVCKISGIRSLMHGAGEPSAALQQVVEGCVNSFGYNRVLWGSDWPMCGLLGGVAAVLNAVGICTRYASISERTALFCDNAKSIYGINGQIWDDEALSARKNLVS